VSIFAYSQLLDDDTLYGKQRLDPRASLSYFWVGCVDTKTQ